MEDNNLKNEIKVADQTSVADQINSKPDGELKQKIGRTTYRIRVFFNHETSITAKDRIERLIKEDLMREAC